MSNPSAPTPRSTGRFELIAVADTRGRFAGFAPFVASINNAGIVAFQAALEGGGTGVYTADADGRITTVAESSCASFGNITSHPDINDRGDICFYADPGPESDRVILLRAGESMTVADSAGPLGPTMNESGAVAFRVPVASGAAGIFTASNGVTTEIASTGERFASFHGLPVINKSGAVAFRADLKNGGQGIYLHERGSVHTIAESGDVFAALGAFPILNDAGAVAFVATLHAGGHGIFASSEGRVRSLVETGDAFESLRGVLINNAGHIVFYGTPHGGRLGLFAGPDPARDRILGLGDALLGSVVEDMALNPVSINDAGQLAIRVTLADSRQLILRADPRR